MKLINSVNLPVVLAILLQSSTVMSQSSTLPPNIQEIIDNLPPSVVGSGPISYTFTSSTNGGGGGGGSTIVTGGSGNAGSSSNGGSVGFSSTSNGGSSSGGSASGGGSGYEYSSSGYGGSGTSGYGTGSGGYSYGSGSGITSGGYGSGTGAYSYGSTTGELYTPSMSFSSGSPIVTAYPLSPTAATGSGTVPVTSQPTQKPVSVSKHQMIKNLMSKFLHG